MIDNLKPSTWVPRGGRVADHAQPGAVGHDARGADAGDLPPEVQLRGIELRFQTLERTGSVRLAVATQDEFLAREVAKLNGSPHADSPLTDERLAARRLQAASRDAWQTFAPRKTR